MGALFNMRRMTVTSTGTGTITLGVAASGWRSFSAAPAIPTGTIVSYRISDGADWELQEGVYNSAANTLTRIRTSPESSTGALLNLTTNALVTISSLAEDLVGSNLRLPPRSGNWFGEKSEIGSGAIHADGQILYVPVIVPISTTIDRIGLPMQSGGASMFAKASIFGVAADRSPGSKIADCASPIVLDGYGLKLGTFSANPLLNAGLYWVGVLPNSATPQPKIAANWASFWAQNCIGDFTSYWSESSVAFFQTTTYAAGLPAVATPVLQIGWNTPVALLRAL